MPASRQTTPGTSNLKTCAKIGIIRSSVSLECTSHLEDLPSLVLLCSRAVAGLCSILSRSPRTQYTRRHSLYYFTLRSGLLRGATTIGQHYRPIVVRISSNQERRYKFSGHCREKGYCYLITSCIFAPKEQLQLYPTRIGDKYSDRSAHVG